MIWVVNRLGKSFKNASTTYLNDSADNSILNTEGNACRIIAMPSIERKFYNDYIYVLYDLPMRYIYVYLISKLIISEEKIQKII